MCNQGNKPLQWNKACKARICVIREGGGIRVYVDVQCSLWFQQNRTLTTGASLGVLCLCQPLAVKTLWPNICILSDCIKYLCEQTVLHSMHLCSSFNKVTLHFCLCFISRSGIPQTCTQGQDKSCEPSGLSDHILPQLITFPPDSVPALKMNNHPSFSVQFLTTSDGPLFRVGFGSPFPWGDLSFGGSC